MKRTIRSLVVVVFVVVVLTVSSSASAAIFGCNTAEEIENKIQHRLDLLNNEMRRIALYTFVSFDKGIEKLTRESIDEITGAFEVKETAKFLMLATPNAVVTKVKGVNRCFFTPAILLSSLSDEELLSILCHEVSHIYLRHKEREDDWVDSELSKINKENNPVSYWDKFLSIRSSKEFLALVREFELEADFNGAIMMEVLGYNGEASYTSLQKMIPSWFEYIVKEEDVEHPHIKKRVENIKKAIGK